MSIRNTVTAGGFVTAIAATEAQLVLSVSEDITIAAGGGAGPELPVGPVVLRVGSTNNAHNVKLSADHVVLGNALVVVNVEPVPPGPANSFVLRTPSGGGTYVGGGNTLTVASGESVMVVCVDATAGASVWAKIKG